MAKDRLAAFFDALLAIIMTVLALELKKPDPMGWGGLWAIRNDLLAYFISFFWLSALWSSNHAEWEYVRTIDGRVVWSALGTLFCASLVPYATSLLSTNFNDSFPQVFYGIVIVATTAANMRLYSSLIKADPTNNTLRHFVHFNRHMTPVDLAVKAVGLLLAVFLWPPAASLSTAIAATIVFGHRLMRRRSSRFIN